MPLGRSGKANCLTHPAFAPSAPGQVLLLDWLRIPLARLVLIRIELARVCALIVCIIPREAKQFSPGFELQKLLLFVASKDARQEVATVVIKRGPEPPRCLGLAPGGRGNVPTR